MCNVVSPIIPTGTVENHPQRCADRAEQALELLALDPMAECLADTCSYGCRTERSVRSAIERCFVSLAGRHKAEWVLARGHPGLFRSPVARPDGRAHFHRQGKATGVA